MASVLPAIGLGIVRCDERLADEGRVGLHGQASRHWEEYGQNALHIAVDVQIGWRKELVATHPTTVAQDQSGDWCRITCLCQCGHELFGGEALADVAICVSALQEIRQHL